MQATEQSGRVTALLEACREAGAQPQRQRVQKAQKPSQGPELHQSRVARPGPWQYSGVLAGELGVELAQLL